MVESFDTLAGGVLRPARSDRRALIEATALQRQFLVLRGDGLCGVRCCDTALRHAAPNTNAPRTRRPIDCVEQRCPSDVRSTAVPDPWPNAPARSDFHQCEVRVPDVDDSVTGLIRAWGDGDTKAGDQLFARVYDELRLIARRLRRRSTARGDQTLDTTALVHEVYLRLAGAGSLSVHDRGHFFAVAVRATRQIVSNYARDAQALKRGGAAIIDTLDGALAEKLGAVPDDLVDRVTALDAALRRLEKLHPRPCRVVECRYFGGLSIPETALALDISEATVKRDWAVAQAWLHRALRDTDTTHDV